ncbi:phosphotransferase enzyme family protein [Candidatus Colwellia aromaticivorans]|uniref:phosphotransferase enzyme family protein n=1 Tax=Candidatus Colwellia aromaticivorans TaxID=2267621 RepID=UPI000DF16F9C|nr:phosphotransferase [Candidatus Colwellia aromaticivorans]
MIDFYSLALEHQEAHLLELAEKSLSSWNLSGKLTLIKHRENAVYSLEASDGERYALRIHRVGYHSNEALKSELQWVNALKEYGLGVPKALVTQNGDFFALIKTESITDVRQVDLLAWVKGEQIGSIEEGLDTNPNQVRENYLIIGQQAAKLHNQSSTWTLPENFERHAWDTEALVGEKPFWGPFWELEALTDEQKQRVILARDLVRQHLPVIGRNADDYSMIHADFVPENILVDGNTVEIIDFDDAGFGWHLFELATALYFIQEDPNYEIAKQAMIKGYRQLRDLSDDKLKHLSLFMLARSFTYLGWVHTRSETETAKELTPLLVEMSLKAIDEYMKK